MDQSNVRGAALLIIIAVLATSVYHGHADTQNTAGKLYPVDEAHKNPSFEKFRDSLVEAIEKKDKKFLLDHIHENIALRPTRESLRAFYKKSNMKEESQRGGPPDLSWLDEYVGPELFQGSAKAHFEKQWFNNTRLDSLTIWEALGRVLRFGGSFTNDSCTTFHAPYTWSNWPADTPFQLAITGSDVYLYKYAFSRKPCILDTLSHDLVYATPLVVGGAPMTKIRTADGVEGYVEHRYIGSPFSWGAEFRFINDQWFITEFTTIP